VEQIMKLPAIQFYTGDWRKDPGIQALDFETRGIWFEMLCLMNESQDRGRLTLNGTAMPVAALARILGIDVETLDRCIEKLLEYGVASREEETGIIFNRRMARDEDIRKKRAAAGKLGGNPLLLKQNPTFTPTNEQPIAQPNANPFRAEDEVEDEVLSLEAIPLPPGFPATLSAARGMAETAAVGIDPDFVRDVWEKLRDVGGLDGSKRQVLQFGSYVARRWRNEQMEWRTKRKSAPSSSQPIYDSGAGDEPELNLQEIIRQRKAKEEAEWEAANNGH
jgi:hypothetical protein